MQSKSFGYVVSGPLLLELAVLANHVLSLISVGIFDVVYSVGVGRSTASAHTIDWLSDQLVCLDCWVLVQLVVL